MSRGLRLPRPPGLARVIAVVGLLAGCVPMLAMVPAGFAGALGLFGLTAGSGVAASLGGTLAPVGKPLLLLSTALLAAGGCAAAAPR